MSLGNILVVIVIVAFAAIILFSSNYNGNAKVILGDVEVEAEIADSYAEKMIGLMRHDSLEEGKGMLFINAVPKRSGIWMMNMSFPIDIIWLSEDNEIIHIVEDAQPCKVNCTMHKPEDPAKYVLEVRSGFAEKNDIKLNDSVKIDLPEE